MSIRSLRVVPLVLLMVAATFVVAPSASAAIVVVDCPADDLQAAIDSANPTDVIEITGTCVGQFVMTENDLTLQGNPTATLDGDGAGTTLTVPAGMTATVQGLTITGGQGADGAAGADGSFGAFGDLCFDITDNPDGGNGGGGTDGTRGAAGGILNQGSLTITDSTITGNRGGNGGNGGLGGEGGFAGLSLFFCPAAGDGGDGADGGNASDGGAGGIRNEGTLSIAASTITDNRGGTGGTGGAGGFGGWGGSVTADQGSIGCNLCVGGGGVGGSGADATMVGGGGGAGGNGGDGGAGGAGGIANTGDATVVNSTISANQAGSGGIGGSGGEGGMGGDSHGGQGGIGCNVCTVNSSGSGGGGGQGGTGGSGGTGGDGGDGGPGGTGAIHSPNLNTSMTASSVSGNTGGLSGDGGTRGLAGNGGAGTGGEGGIGCNVCEDSEGFGGPGGPGGTGGPGRIGGSAPGGSGGTGCNAGVNCPSTPGMGGTYGTDGPSGAVPSGSTGASGKPGTGGNRGVTMTASILAGNSGEFGISDCAGWISSGGDNILGVRSSCDFDDQPSDQSGTFASPLDPKLLALTDNGGPTLTMMPKASSPAIDVISPGGGNCEPTDQRGVARPFGTNCDVGAVERDIPGGTGTTIELAPSGRVLSGDAAVFFSTDRDDATFECSLDAVPFTACVSPWATSGLLDGDHTFAVRDVVNGVPDPTPASASWTSDTASHLPDAEVASGNKRAGRQVIDQFGKGEVVKRKAKPGQKVAFTVTIVNRGTDTDDIEYEAKGAYVTAGSQAVAPGESAVLEFKITAGSKGSRVRAKVFTNSGHDPSQKDAVIAVVRAV